MPPPPWPQALLQEENDDLGRQVDTLRGEGQQAEAQLSRLLGDNAELMVGLVAGSRATGSHAVGTHVLTALKCRADCRLKAPCFPGPFRPW